MLKRILIFVLLVTGSIIVYSQSESNSRIIVIGAHPDDCDIDAGGTAALLAEMGNAVKFVSITNGDAGHQSMGGGVLAKIRRAEAKEAAKRLGIDEYEVLDNHDGELMPSLNVRMEIIRQIRDWNADVVIAPRPNDYHPDHRYTGVLVQDAAYMVAVPNIASDTPPLKENPVFLYSYDHFEKPNPFHPEIVVDIGETFDKKINALDAHTSQFYEWLPWIGGYKEEVPEDEEARKLWLAKRRKRPISSEMRKSLIKWYGQSHAAQVEHAEAFQICEYGHQPSEDEIRKLFPIFNK